MERRLVGLVRRRRLATKAARSRQRIARSPPPAALPDDGGEGGDGSLGGGGDGGVGDGGGEEARTAWQAVAVAGGGVDGWSRSGYLKLSTNLSGVLANNSFWSTNLYAMQGIAGITHDEHLHVLHGLYLRPP